MPPAPVCTVPVTVVAVCVAGKVRGWTVSTLDVEFTRRVRRLVPGLAGLILLAWALDHFVLRSCLLSALAWTRSAGFVLLLAGFLLAGVSGRQLTLYGRGDVALPRGTTDRLVQRGLFCLMRHPAFTGFMLILLGGGLVARSCGFTFVSAPLGILYLVVFTFRVEEPQLVERFGDEYRRYRQRVPAFFPLPWENCRRSLPAVKGGKNDAGGAS